MIDSAAASARVETSFVLEVGFDARTSVTTIVVNGDVDAHRVPELVHQASHALDHHRRLVIRLDAVTIFGVAAAEGLEEILAHADLVECSLNISGLTRFTAKILELLDIRDPRIDTDDQRDRILSPVIFDAVLSKAVLRGREAVCITTCDVDAPRIVFVNEAFSTLTGYRADDIIGMNPKLLQGPLTERGVIETLKEALRTEETFHGEAVNYRLDGTPFWMNWKIVTSRVGTLSYYVALQRDGTAMRQQNRIGAARRRLLRRLPDTNSLSEALDVLCDAIHVVVEDPGARVTATIDGPQAPFRRPDNEASQNTSNVLVTELIDASTSEIRVPFHLHDATGGTVTVAPIHPDWLELTNLADIEDLIETARATLTDLDA